MSTAANVRHDDWRELATAFRSLRNVIGTLSATWSAASATEVTPPQFVLTEINTSSYSPEFVLAEINAKKHSPEFLAWQASTFRRIATFSRGGQWSTLGDDRHEQFIELAIQGACYLGHALNRGSQKGDPWLDHVAEHVTGALNLDSVSCEHVAGADFCRATGFIDDICEMSALACLQLATAAWAAAHSPDLEFPTMLARNIYLGKEKLGLRYDQLAAKIGISKKACHHHVHRGVRPHSATIKAYADTFKMSVEELDPPDPANPRRRR